MPLQLFNTYMYAIFSTKENNGSKNTCIWVYSVYLPYCPCIQPFDSILGSPGRQKIQKIQILTKI